MISSNKIMMKERLMNHRKERIKTITCGSILPLTGKNGLDLKKNTQGKVRNDRKNQAMWSLNKAAAAQRFRTS